MSDHAPAQVIIYDCPPEHRKAVHEALYDEGFSLDFGGQDDELALDTAYGDYEARLVANDDIAQRLLEITPDITFAAWVDPKYEYDGDITMYAPDLGRFDGHCDSEGTIHITTDEVRKLIDENPEADDLKNALLNALGDRWEKRILELRETK